jgi:hypothetical protein
MSVQEPLHAHVLSGVDVTASPSWWRRPRWSMGRSCADTTGARIRKRRTKGLPTAVAARDWRPDPSKKPAGILASRPFSIPRGDGRLLAGFPTTESEAEARPVGAVPIVSRLVNQS